MTTIDKYFKKRKRKDDKKGDGGPSRKKPKLNDSGWDFLHFKLPHHPKNIYKRGNKELSKWYLIKTVLETVKARNENDLKKMILKMNAGVKFQKYYNLTNFFNSLKKQDYYKFFDKILPRMQSCVLQLPQFFNGGRNIEILVQLKENEVVLTRREIACLMCCSFFCVIPDQLNEKLPPTNTFFRLFTTGRPQHLVNEKLRTLLNYFFQFFEGDGIEGSVCFKRLKYGKSENWETYNRSDYNVMVFERGCIEDYHPLESSHVDFANKNIGGGVLGNGCVQEEILFLIHAECIVAKFICERLRRNESLIISGALKFSKYIGYSGTYQFDGSCIYDDSNKMGNCDSRIKRRSLICIDAVDYKLYRNPLKQQFRKSMIRRELDKCFLGFKNSPYREIVTGNWGCGAFGGYCQLKALIQVIAATCCNKSVVYFTFAEPTLSSDQFREFIELIKGNVSVSKLYSFLLSYYENRRKSEDLFGYIQRNLSNEILIKKGILELTKDEDEDEDGELTPSEIEEILVE